MSRRRYRLAFIGYGSMAGWHHKNVVERAPEFEIYGSYDIDPKRQEAAAENGLIVYASADELLADPTIDVVTVATTNNFHADYSIRALEAGKNVICEKPVTMDSAELISVIDAQKRTGRHFAVHQNRRWDPDYLTLKRVLEEGTLGRLFQIKSRVLGSRGVPEGWRTSPEAGGGMMLDWGVHLLDQILMLIPERLTEVNCRMHYTNVKAVDDGFLCQLIFESGLYAMVEVDTTCFVGEPRWHVRGDVGTLTIDDWDVNGRIVHARDMETVWEEEILYTAAGPTKTMAPRTRFSEETLPLPVVREDWINFYHNFAAVLDGREKPLVLPEENLFVMRVMEAAFESDRTRSTIPIDFAVGDC